MLIHQERAARAQAGAGEGGRARGHNGPARRGGSRPTASTCVRWPFRPGLAAVPCVRRAGDGRIGASVAHSIAIGGLEAGSLRRRPQTPTVVLNPLNRCVLGLSAPLPRCRPLPVAVHSIVLVLAVMCARTGVTGAALLWASLVAVVRVCRGIAACRRPSRARAGTRHRA